MSKYLVVGHFGTVEETRKAIDLVRSEAFLELKLYSPFPCPELDEDIYQGKKRSPVRFFTLFGGIVGCMGAFLMTSWMSRDWPLRTSAKPIVSIPAYVVIAFECTILLGAICTLIGMFINSGLPNCFHYPAYRPEFSEGTFGLGINVGSEEIKRAEESLARAGARKVEVNYVR